MHSTRHDQRKFFLYRKERVSSSSIFFEHIAITGDSYQHRIESDLTKI